MENKFYKVRIADYGVPAFCDSEVNYYDTAGNIRLQYEKPGPLLSHVKLLGRRIWEYGPQTYRFCNAWNWEQDTVMDRVRVDAVYPEDLEPELPENRLIRCVKLQITRPRMLNLLGEWMNYWDGWFWGYPHMIVRREPDILENSLYYPDHSFQSAAEVQQDMERPVSVDFRRFFLKIHGDG